MSTRATYQISNNIYYPKEKTYFYIHSDGYPQGAADYFWNMHNVKNNRGSYAGRFMRGNETAEFTVSHEIHGDTEYRYNLDKNGNLIVRERTNFRPSSWKRIYNGSWYDFINQYRESDEKLYLFKLSYCNEVMTICEAKTYVKGKKLEVNDAMNLGHTHIAKSSEEEADNVKNQIVAILKNLFPNQSEKQIIELAEKEEFSEKDKKISIVWHVDDVRSVREDLSESQAIEVLKHFKKNHVSFGSVWEEIKTIADELYPESES